MVSVRRCFTLIYSSTLDIFRACGGMDQSHLVLSPVFCPSSTNKSRVTALSGVNLSSEWSRTPSHSSPFSLVPSLPGHCCLAIWATWFIVRITLLTANRKFAVSTVGARLLLISLAAFVHHFCCSSLLLPLFITFAVAPLYYMIYLFFHRLWYFSHPRSYSHS